MRKIFISVGMNGRERSDIEADILRAEKWIYEDIYNRQMTSVKTVDNLDCDAPEDAGRLWYLGEAIKKLGDCDTCYFVKGWQNYKACRVHMEICKLYGIAIIEE